MKKKKSKGKTYWCPNGCGKTVMHYPLGRFGKYRCSSCNKLIAKTKAELMKLVR